MSRNLVTPRADEIIEHEERSHRDSGVRPKFEATEVRPAMLDQDAVPTEPANETPRPPSRPAPLMEPREATIDVPPPTFEDLRDTIPSPPPEHEHD